MLSVGVFGMGKTRVVFIYPRAKANSSYAAISSSRRVCCLTSEQYVVITGGHCSRMERQDEGLFEKKHIKFIEVEPHMGPPNSHDINPMGYAIWGALQQRVYHQRQFKTVEQLKRAIVTEWQKLSQRFSDNSINEWR